MGVKATFGSALSLAACLLMGATGPVLAGDLAVGSFEPGSVFADTRLRSGVNTPPTVLPLDAVSPQGTTYVTTSIAQSYALCANLPQKEYTVDCLGERLEALARSMPDTGDYAEAKVVITEASQKLRSLAQANRSPTKPRARVKTTVNNKTVTTAPLTPVRTEAVDATLAQAVGILDEAETQLLRSSGSSDRRKVQYQAIAQAIGSNKILLRAA